MKRPVSLILAALLLSSTMGVAVLAEETEPTTPPTETITPEVEEEKQDIPYNIRIGYRMLERGMVVPNRKTAKEGELVILTAYEQDFQQNGKNYRYEFKGWQCKEKIDIIPISRTAAVFYMPAEDVTIYPVFETVDMTEYYDWESVEKEVDKLHRNESLDVDMEDEPQIPYAVMAALAGKDADVTFTTDDCIFTINGMDITLGETKSDYALTYEDYTLNRMERWKLGNSDILSIKVNVDSAHTVKAELHCFAAKNVKMGYLYKLDGYTPTFISAVTLKNGEAVIPVTESGTYVMTTSALADIDMAVPVDSNTTVPIVGGKLVPLSAVVGGKLYFKTEELGKLLYSEYTNPYGDTKSHKYRSQIDFVSARGLLDGASAEAFAPNSGITTGEFMRSIARLRGIPDADAYDYCTQLDIFTYEYVEDDLLTRNEMSVIFTNFINHLIEFPKSFGGYTMEGFDGNAAAWVGDRFRELKQNDGSYDWKENATRAEAAYLLEAAVRTIVTGG